MGAHFVWGEKGTLGGVFTRPVYLLRCTKCNSTSNVPIIITLLSVTVRVARFKHMLGQVSLLPSVDRKMSTDQSAVMLCGWD